MKEKHVAREGMTWLEMDVLDLKFGEDEFDLVLDKGLSASFVLASAIADETRHNGVSPTSLLCEGSEADGAAPC